MYDELVKRVRQVAEEVCDDYDVDPYIAEQRFFVIEKAADVIEELSRLHEAQRQNLITLMNEEPETEWIPVTDRLPKTRESILGKKSSKVIVAFCFDDGTQGTDTAHTLNGEWVFEDHITVVARTVTHWMPLPSAPTEE